ncbi:DUF2207 domain-containing protein [Sporosarcina luteola]|uniref:DUF2207 domain-containing protein n=1 Tax=Sporosarcina luteola TaxID=582850 RepID=UPI00203F8E67|nr:DUF2207 domain-containing protein [Sporosarcina luteola]MCM3638628.1 DUF2207 domain-containing protein [Sporosarcina luteola]
MRKIVVIIIMLFILSPTHVHAKSFTIDRVQIKGWVQTNGDMLVNEVFTYTLDGEFSRLTRSFPEKHLGQIHNFEAYHIASKDPIVGEIDESTLTKAAVSRKGGTYATEIQAENDTMTILYVYKMQNAVTSYDTYSDLAITFFEGSSNHDMDLNNVDITFAMPGDAGNDQIHGFIHDREGQVRKVYRDGISFHTPKSAAYTVTGTRVLFPSTIMTGQQKIAAPVSFEEAIRKEQRLIDKKESRWANIPAAKNVADGLSIFFIVLAGMLVLLRQRILSLFGSTDLVLQTDPSYLAFVDQNGRFNRKNFLAGLFSLVEKGIIKAELTESAARFQGKEGAPDKTLVFRLLQSNEQLKKSKHTLLPHEQYLVTWLFKGRVGHRKFHLHDMAGPSVREDKENRTYLRKQRQFHGNHEIWHEDVLNLMEEAGALSTKVPKMMKVVIFLLLTITTMYGFYADGAGGWGIAFPAIVAGIVYYFYSTNPGNKWPAILFFIGMFSAGAQIVASEVTEAVLSAVICGAVFFFLIPKAVPISFTALYTKMSITKYRRQMKRGIPDYLHSDEADRWITRAYLLNKSKKRLPRIKRGLPESSSLAPLFALQTDPLYFTYSTWGPMSINKSGSSWGGGSSDSGGYSGGGGGDGGGGGAGAE